MKFIPVALILVLLTSCTAVMNDDSEPESADTIETTVPVDDEFFDDFDDEMNWMNGWDDMNMNWEMGFQNEIIEVDSWYNHPGWRTDMVVTMEVNDGVITAIEASAPANLRRWFNDSLQQLVWGSLEDAENFYAAWSTLASDAFNNAVRSL